jgi:3D (Asp-Asp-Asp) domain-containing protein
MTNLFVSLALVLLFGNVASAGEPTRLSVTVAAYTAVRGQTDSTPNVTASGLRITSKHHGNIVALSSDLKKHFKFGDRIKIYIGDQVIDAVCEDVMHPKWRKRVDLLLSSTKACFRWGLKKGVILVNAE